VPALTLASLTFSYSPVRTVAGAGQTTGAGGGAQALTTSIVSAGLTFAYAPVRTVAGAGQTTGAGGGAQAIVHTIVSSGLTFQYSPVRAIANQGTVSIIFPDPVNFPRRIQATATASGGTAIVGDVAWQFGEGGAATGNPVIYNYSSGGSFIVTATFLNSLGFLVVATGMVTIPVIPETPPNYAVTPRESVADVLNLTLGRHPYEPMVARPFPVDRLGIRLPGVIGVPAATLTEQLVLTLTPTQDIVVRSISIDGDADGLWILYIGGARYDVKRTQRSNGEADMVRSPMGIHVGRGVVLELRVKNIAFTDASYNATLHADKGPLGVI
jgi:hypothetical protein